MAFDIEQYRPGFEAWAAENDHPTGRYPDGSYCGLTEQRWEGWVAAKFEASSVTAAHALIAECEALHGLPGDLPQRLAAWLAAHPAAPGAQN